MLALVIIPIELVLIASPAVLIPLALVKIAAEFVFMEPVLAATPNMFMATPSIAVLRP